MKFDIAYQGHWWMDYMKVRRRLPGAILFELGTEQKRPQYAFLAQDMDDDHRVIEIGIGPRESGSLGFREGEDGSNPTVAKITLPRTLPWRVWDMPVIDEDKWGLRGAVFTRNRYSYEYPFARVWRALLSRRS